MGKLVLVTGGTRSGKSKYAESIVAQEQTPVLYIATAQAYDDEMRMRIRLHQESRPAEWGTIEAYRGLGEVIARESGKYPYVLLDCLTIMVTNLLLEDPGIMKEDFSSAALALAEEKILIEAEKLAQGIAESSSTVVLVTNELGSGIVPEYPLSRCFRDIAGRVNQFMAGKADEAYLVVCGIPMRLK